MVCISILVDFVGFIAKAILDCLFVSQWKIGEKKGANQSRSSSRSTLAQSPGGAADRRAVKAIHSELELSMVSYLIVWSCLCQKYRQ